MDNGHKKLTERFVRPDMDPHKLQHFLAVYQHGNFHRAAEEGSVTQQAVSKAVARLEDQLGVPLFERTPLGANPTSYADALARHAKIILSEINLAASELMAMRGSTEGLIQIGVAWSFVPEIAPKAVENFRKRRPKVGIRLDCGGSSELFPKLLKGELDFVVSAPPKELSVDKAINLQSLYMESDSLVVRKDHPLTEKEKVNMDDLNKYPWVLDLSSTNRWHAICAKFAEKGVEPPRDVIDVNSLGMAKSLLLRGDYISLIAPGLYALELELGLMKILKPDLLSMSRLAVLATRKGSELQPAAELFKSILIKVCEESHPLSESEEGMS